MITLKSRTKKCSKLLKYAGAEQAEQAKQADDSRAPRQACRAAGSTPAPHGG